MDRVYLGDPGDQEVRGVRGNPGGPRPLGPPDLPWGQAALLDLVGRGILGGRDILVVLDILGGWDILDSQDVPANMESKE